MLVNLRLVFLISPALRQGCIQPPLMGPRLLSSRSKQSRLLSTSSSQRQPGKPLRLSTSRESRTGWGRQADVLQLLPSSWLLTNILLFLTTITATARFAC